MLKASPTLTDIEYPESDGEPMAETDTHRVQMTDALIYPLKERYRHRSDVYVSGNLFLYCEEGNPGSVVAPDVFIVFGVPNQLRCIYKLWEEKKAPVRRQAETRATIAEARAAEEAEARRAAEAEVERLRALLAQQDQTTDDQ